MPEMSVRQLWAALAVIGSIVMVGWQLDARWNQGARVGAIEKARVQAAAQALKDNAEIRNDIKVMGDRIAAQLYAARVAVLNDRIQDLEDKKAAGRLAPYEESELRRYQARLAELSKQWPLMAQSFGNSRKPGGELD